MHRDKPDIVYKATQGVLKSYPENDEFVITQGDLQRAFTDKTIIRRVFEEYLEEGIWVIVPDTATQKEMF